MMSPQQRRTAWAWLALCVAILVLAGPASARAAGRLSIRQVNLQPDGTASVVVSVPDATTQYGPADFTVTESGASVEGLKATPLSQSTDQKVSVALLFDTSGSKATTGTVSQPAAPGATTLASRKKAAADLFVSLLPSQVEVELIAFASSATVTKSFTTDHVALSAAIDSLRAGGDKSLYDAVVLGSRELNKQRGTQHMLVIVSDGGDTASKATLAAASAAVRDAKAFVTAVGVNSPAFDGSALRDLADAGGGDVVAVTQGALSTTLRQIATDIASQYVLTYHATKIGPKELELSVTLGSGAAAVSDHAVILNPRVKIAPNNPDELSLPGNTPLVRAFASGAGRWIGIGSAFVAIAILFGMLLVGAKSREVGRLLRGLQGKRKRAADPDDEMRTGIAAALGVAADVLDLVPKAKDRQVQLRMLLERSAWPLRASEFRVLQAVGAVAGGLVGGIMLPMWWLGLPCAAVGSVIPMMILKRRCTKRTTLFVSQLPETLELLAGSLQAGYGFMQALDTLVAEASAPTSEEFGRVLAEARLGMPLDEALQDMGQRIDSEDFGWVVLAINIQRQVGGNLAILLKTVANTLRERENVRRQIKVLSAEGRLSAGILTGLPFGLAGYIALVNPSYIGKLFTESFGRIMVGGALVMMGIGIAWMRKLIKIEV